MNDARYADALKYDIEQFSRYKEYDGSDLREVLLEMHKRIVDLEVQLDQISNESP